MVSKAVVSVPRSIGEDLPTESLPLFDEAGSRTLPPLATTRKSNVRWQGSRPAHWTECTPRSSSQADFGTLKSIVGDEPNPRE